MGAETLPAGAVCVGPVQAKAIDAEKRVEIAIAIDRLSGRMYPHDTATACIATIARVYKLKRIAALPALF